MRSRPIVLCVITGNKFNDEDALGRPFFNANNVLQHLLNTMTALPQRSLENLWFLSRRQRQACMNKICVISCLFVPLRLPSLDKHLCYSLVVFKMSVESSEVV